MMNDVQVDEDDDVKEDAKCVLVIRDKFTDYMTMMLIMLKMMLTFGLRQRRKIT